MGSSHFADARFKTLRILSACVCGTVSAAWCIYRVDLPARGKHRQETSTSGNSRGQAGVRLLGNCGHYCRTEGAEHFALFVGAAVLANKSSSANC
jgi:hypothetical protein